MFDTNDGGTAYRPLGSAPDGLMPPLEPGGPGSRADRNRADQALAWWGGPAVRERNTGAESPGSDPLRTEARRGPARSGEPDLTCCSRPDSRDRSAARRASTPSRSALASSAALPSAALLAAGVGLPWLAAPSGRDAPVAAAAARPRVPSRPLCRRDLRPVEALQRARLVHRAVGRPRHRLAAALVPVVKRTVAMEPLAGAGPRPRVLAAARRRQQVPGVQPGAEPAAGPAAEPAVEPAAEPAVEPVSG